MTTSEKQTNMVTHERVKEKKLRRAITRYVNARIRNSWAGAEDPVDRPAIELELKLAQVRLSTVIEEVLK